MGNQASLRVFDVNFNLLAQIDGYESFIFTRRHGKVGDFTLTIYSHMDGAMYLEVGNMVVLDQWRSGYIEHVEGVQNPYMEGMLLTVSGRSPEYMLSFRATLPYATPPQKAEVLMKDLVDLNIAERSHRTRQHAGIVVLPVTGLLPQVNWTWEPKILLDHIEKICAETALGIRLLPNIEDNRFYFDVVEGVDRGIDQQEHPQVILSAEYDNVLEQTFTESSLGYKNTALVVGGSDNKDTPEVNRPWIWVNDRAVGVDRRETVVDNKSVGIADRDKLIALGEEALAAAPYVESADGTLNPHHPLKADRDYFLGDFVTLRHRGAGLLKQITEITESWDENGYQQSCVLGQRPPGLLEKMR